MEHRSGGDTFSLSPARPSPRRMTYLLTLLAVAAVLVGAGGAWLARPTGPDVALALSWEEGRTYRYRIEIGMDGDMSLFARDIPFTADFGEVVRMTVLEIDPSGATTFEVTVESISGTFNGIPIPPDPRQIPPVRMTVTDHGRVVTEEGLTLPAPTSGPGSTNPFSQMFPLFPDHPVGPGDTWEIRYRQPIPFGRGGVEVDTVNAFLRYHGVDGTRVAVLDSRVGSLFDFEIDLARLAEAAGQANSSVPSDPPVDAVVRYEGATEGRQVAWVDPRAGEVVKVTSEADVELGTELVGGAAPAGLGLEFSFDGELTASMERL